MFYCIVEKDQYVFRQNDPASCFFIVHEGLVQVEINDIPKKDLGPRSCFGDLALMYNAPRSASIKAKVDTRFWAIDRKTFKRAVEEVATSKFKENREFIEKVPFFDTMTVAQKDAVAMVLLAQVFKKGEVIFNDGDQAASYYIIQEVRLAHQGSAECIKNNEVVRVLLAGESFGEQALYESARRTLTVRAGTDCKCLALARGDLQSIMGTKILEVIKGNWTRWAIEKDPVFKKLTKLQTEKIIMNVDFTKKQPGGEVILERGSELTKLVIVLAGSLLYTTKTFPKGTLFDSSFLYPQANTRNTLEDDLITGSEGAELAQISISRFHAIIGKNLEEVFQNNANSHELKMLGDNLDFRKVVENLRLEDLVYIKKLGEGQFGQVFLVKGRGPNDLFALKAISKAQIVEEKLEKHTLQEKEVLEAVNFPFIMQLYRTFKDDNFVYFLLSFVRGMELFDVIRDISRPR